VKFYQQERGKEQQKRKGEVCAFVSTNSGKEDRMRAYWERDDYEYLA
jgi:hypothetical protein